MECKAYEFQFLYGTIKSLVMPTPKGAAMSFNSSMVQLKEAEVKGYLGRFNRFNSSMVQLKAVLEQERGIRIKGFNSSMVQLKAPQSIAHPAAAAWFQFLYGTIKRFFLPILDEDDNGFNSSMVQLKGMEMRAMLCA